jgi:hypothetical protein
VVSGFAIKGRGSHSEKGHHAGRQKTEIRNCRFILGLGALASVSVSAQNVIAVADGINMWDGQWHYDATLYGWVPWIYNLVDPPPIAGGGSQTITTEPHQYLKYVEGGALVQGTVRKGDWNLWTDFVFLNLNAGTTHTREIGLPGGDPLLSVNRSIDSSLRAAVWTLAPGYTVMNNDIGSWTCWSVCATRAYEYRSPTSSPHRRSS